MKNNILLSTMALVSLTGHAMDKAKEQQAKLLALYNKPLTTSSMVAGCFATKYPVVTQKRLFFHICAQAGKDKNFNVNNFRELIDDINRQDDNIRSPIQTLRTALFHKILNYIPWNGNIDTECGVTWYETMINDRFVKLGINADAEAIYVYINNENDLDSEVDHSKKNEKEVSSNCDIQKY